MHSNESLSAAEPRQEPGLFDYDLPAERIAQRPVRPYDTAKLLVARGGAGFSTHIFRDLPALLTPGDLLIFNDTKVIPARLFGILKKSGAEAEVLLLEKIASDRWRALGRPMKRLTKGAVIEMPGGHEAEVLDINRDGTFIVLVPGGAPLNSGVMPIPPYIRQGRGDARDIEDYQTHFARSEGSVAAPTASLHFTPELMRSLCDAGCAIEFLTLHVGRASFRQVWDGTGAFEPPESERFEFRPGLLETIAACKRAGGRVIAVGTTVVRALESIVRTNPAAAAGEQRTELFIRPGYEFMAIDGLITNFHQPRSSHLLLVEALLGRKRLAEVYRYALANDYRFLSYGDGMLVI